ncbi:unnamed protein product, partial [Phaeothamnion confervicola]
MLLPRSRALTLCQKGRTRAKWRRGDTASTFGRHRLQQRRWRRTLEPQTSQEAPNQRKCLRRRRSRRQKRRCRHGGAATDCRPVGRAAGAEFDALFGFRRRPLRI